MASPSTRSEPSTRRSPPVGQKRPVRWLPLFGCVAIAAFPAAASDRHPTWSPDSQQIAFSSNRSGSHELWRLPSQGGVEPTQLTDLGAHSTYPSWSPDGDCILFSSNLDGDFDLYLLDLASGDVAPLTDAPGRDWDPQWSPAGDRIAFTSDRDGDFDIYVMDADGSGLRQLTFDDAPDLDPAWTPDGATVAFSRAYRIFAIDLADGSERPITEESSRHPSYSPDGTRLAYTFYTSWLGARFSGLRIASLDGTSAQELAGAGFPNKWGPSWSPDGREVASHFSRNNTYLVSIPAGAGSWTDLTSSQGTDRWLEVPVWWGDLTLVPDGYPVTRSVQFGLSPLATDEMEEHLNEFEQPPMPPQNMIDGTEGYYEIRFSHDGSYGLILDLRSAARRAATWRISMRSSSRPLTLSWNLEGFPSDGTLVLRDPYLRGEILEVDMLAQSQVAIEQEPLTTLEIVYRSPIEATVELSEGWNLVSLPVEVDDPAVQALFPGAISAFARTAVGYAPVQELEPCTGYFVNLSAATTVRWSGLALAECERDLDGGWSLIGGPMEPFAVGAIGQRPADVLVSVFGLSGLYQQVAQLDPGRGYWAHMQQQGSLSISLPGGSLKPAAAPPADPGRQGVLWLESGGHRQEIDLGVSTADPLQAPPLPPGDIPDLRVLKDGVPYLQVPDAADGQEVDLRIQGRDVVLGWDVARDAGGEWSLWVRDMWRPLRGRGQLALGDASPAAWLALHHVGLSTRFELQRSYPNPFNASTVIAFGLPESATVSLSLFDVLGQRVRSLVSGDLPAGKHTVRWDGRDDAGMDLGSGVYLVSLKASGAIATDRLVLLR